MLKNELRDFLRNTYSDDDLKIWFEPLGIERPQQDMVQVTVPHHLFYDWFKDRYKSGFDTELKNFFGPATLVIYSDSQSSSLHHGRSVKGSGPAEYGGQPDVAGDLEEAHAYCSNKEYSFDNFLFNRKNQFPVEAARDFCAGRAATPFAVYSDYGCGKTHLLCAIVNCFKNNVPKKSIFFNNLHYLETISKNKYFKHKNLIKYFSSFDCLVIDNFQDCSKFPELQEALASCFEHMVEHEVPIALAMNAAPSKIRSMNKRLRSILESGLVFEIKKPDLDIRIRYIEQQCAQAGLELSRNDMVEMARAYTEFRQIHGILLKISSWRRLNPEEPMLDMDIILNASGGEEKVNLTPDLVISRAASYFKVDMADITGKSRVQNVVLARQAAMYLLRDLLGIPLHKIGLYFEGKDHSSVSYSISKIKKISETNKDMNNKLAELKLMCKNQQS